MSRPSILFGLFADISTLKGVGPKMRPALAGLCGPRVLDVILHAPQQLLPRQRVERISHYDGLITIRATILGYKAPDKTGRPSYINVSDTTGAPFSLAYFHGNLKYLQEKYPIDSEVVISGRVERYGQRLSMPHPDYLVPVAEQDTIPLLEPVYPLTQGVSNKVLRKIISHALAFLPDLPEWQDKEYLRKQGWPSWFDAITTLHNPTNQTDWDNAKQRLAYDELLAHQAAFQLVRQAAQQLPTEPLHGTGDLQEKIRSSLPFSLTGAQDRALLDIDADLSKPKQMLRLLQGDVGSGKTVVAMIAAARAIESNKQVALMAPTEILARQHFQTLQPWCRKAGIIIDFLAGSTKGKAREASMGALQNGLTNIIVGTHALFQDKVQFQNLGLVIIDEQHRFGVQQRLQLSGKGQNPHLLVMTATPIPRTLLLANHGEMAVSKLDEKPPGRKPILTNAIPQDRLGEVVAGLQRLLDKNGQAYWVCPLVEESEALDLAAAEARFEDLKKHFGNKVGLVHGRLSADEKSAALDAFSNGETSILIATTVIEVGVNVPNATVMVIDHAERFGLSQLHQLRGRVGRGDQESHCILLYDSPLSKTAKKRLTAMRQSEDGFWLAEEDLRLRGAGDILGSKQSGLPALKIADWVEDKDLLFAASDYAKYWLMKDGYDQEQLNVLLHLYDRDQAAPMLRAG